MVKIVRNACQDTREIQLRGYLADILAIRSFVIAIQVDPYPMNATMEAVLAG